jgi:hypothetical protein
MLLKEHRGIDPVTASAHVVITKNCALSANSDKESMKIKEGKDAIGLEEAYLHLEQKLLISQKELEKYRNSSLGRMLRLSETIANFPRRLQAAYERLCQIRNERGAMDAFFTLISKITRRPRVAVDALLFDEDFGPSVVFDVKFEIEKKPLVISWIVGGYMPKGGGHRNIFRMAYHLERFGHTVNLYIADTPLDSHSLADTIRRQMYPIQGLIARYEGNILKSDVLLATHWETVKYVEESKGSSDSLCYFVQDYEPLFYPMGSKFLLAADTYKKGYFHICSGEWAARTIAKRHGARTGHFQFPIDKSIYTDNGRARIPGQIVFFAKPEMARRCFELGVAALEELFKLNKCIRVIMYGSPEAKNYKYNFPVQVQAFVGTLSELAEIYNRSEVGMAFSTTNPSLVPYEMMACGLPIVDLMIEDSEANYGNRLDIASLALADPISIAQSINRLLTDQAERQDRSRKGLELTSKFPSEVEAARTVETLIVEAYERETKASRDEF